MTQAELREKAVALICDIRMASPYTYLPTNYQSQSAVPKKLMSSAKFKMTEENIKKLEAYCADLVREARINELTTLDNQNFLNDSDDFHEYYINRVKELADQRLRGGENV